MAALDPGLLIFDTFAVIGRVVAGRLGLPAVHLCAGHAMVPSRTVPMRALDPKATPSPACHATAATLRERYGLMNATPFSWLDGVSPLLNLYAEPPEFLREEDRGAFAPLAFVGSLLPRLLEGNGADPFRPDGRRRVFVSFGSVAWSYYPEIAEARRLCIAEELGAVGAQVVMSTAGHALTGATAARLAQTGARVEAWVDQRAALRNAEVFITHHGLNSTHEAMWFGVPMLSMPFFTDQPALAARCQALGLALPLVERAETELVSGVVASQLAALQADRSGFVARLREARRWEEAVIAGRDAVVDRMVALALATA